MNEVLSFEVEGRAAAAVVTAEAGGLVWELLDRSVSELYATKADFVLMARLPGSGSLWIAKNPNGPSGKHRWVFSFNGLDTFEVTGETLAGLLSKPGMIEVISGRSVSFPEPDEEEERPARWFQLIDISLIRIGGWRFGSWRF